MLVKLCGFTEKTSLEVAVAEGCNFLGFVFYEKSPRFIDLQKAAEISSFVPSNIAKVAVLVNPSFNFLEKVATEFSPDFFQFHHGEDENFLKKSRQKFPQIKIIKSFQISKKEDFEQIKHFENLADFFLFDSKVENSFGGSGQKFNWEILQNFHSKKNWFLSGGINLANINQALKIKGLKMIDISSGIEEIRGEKSAKLISQLMRKIRDNS